MVKYSGPESRRGKILIDLFIHLFIYLSIYLFIFIFIHLSIYLTIIYLNILIYLSLGIGKGQWTRKQERKDSDLKKEGKIIKAQKRRINEKGEKSIELFSGLLFSQVNPEV